MQKKSLRWIIVAAVVGVAGFFGYQYWQQMKSALPEGIASGNGRIEAKLVDVSAKEALRVKEIRVAEGDLVHPDQVLVVLDTATLETALSEAKLNVAATQERLAVTRANITKREAEIELAKIEVARSRELVEQRAGSQRELDLRQMTLKTTTASLEEEQAKLRTTEQEVNVAQAKVANVQTRIDDATLRSPVNGRVLYRLAEVGEVVAAGGKALTLVNLDDVYMEIFLPSLQAARLKIGAEARLTVDYAPGRAVAGYVSFVSPEAQFTPKQVETQSEREKLMFRVKIQVPEKTVESYIELIKTGVRGVGYVKVNDSAVWPDWLQNVLTPPTGTAEKGAG
ncbi:MAG: HlyD family efflux transporter periplasmic adaptor subunit [Rhodopila sp.]|nr:HlyD family efflux transporter periplasmic adaptor subunit [Rhodopila sp.]